MKIKDISIRFEGITFLLSITDISCHVNQVLTDVQSTRKHNSLPTVVGIGVKYDDMVQNTIADLFLCPACEQYRWNLLQTAN